MKERKKKGFLLFIIIAITLLIRKQLFVLNDTRYFQTLGGELPPSVWRVMASRLSELVTVVKLIMVAEFETEELRQGG